MSSDAGGGTSAVLFLEKAGRNDSYSGHEAKAAKNASVVNVTGIFVRTKEALKGKKCHQLRWPSG